MTLNLTWATPTRLLAVDKLYAGELVLRWGTTGEPSRLYVFVFVFPLSLNFTLLAEL